MSRRSLSKLRPKPLDRAEDDLRAARKAYLRAAGWVSTCELADRVWRWRKLIGGSYAILAGDDAVSVQRAMDEDAAP